MRPTSAQPADVLVAAPPVAGDQPCEVFTIEQLTEFGFDLPPLK